MSSQTTSKPVKTHLPCPCGKSSDAFTVFSDGHGYCFSGICSSPYFSEVTYEGHKGLPIINIPATTSAPQSYTTEYLPLRGLTKETLATFKVKTRINEAGKPYAIEFPYGDTFKVRTLDRKQFFTEGDIPNAPLFGMSCFPAASSKYITITEGELDAASVYQMLGRGYPVVSVRSSSSARGDCERVRDYLNSFERIYLCFDGDEPGQQAVNSVARLFDFNKVFHVKMPPDMKDANEFLQKGKSKEFGYLWWNSKRILPEGIISSQVEFDQIIDNANEKPSIALPFPTLQNMTYGLRTGETYLFTALEGIGKTEILRAIEHHLLKTTDSNIAIIHLEESKERSLKGLAGYELQTPVHLPDSGVAKEAVKQAIASAVKVDNRLHLYSHFGSDDPDVILDIIRFLATSCNCKYIFLDHITMVVSGLASDDERKALDYISTQLAMMVESLDFCLVFVSHVNDQGLTRGSRNISKVAGTWVHLDRNQLAETEEERNTTKLLVKKNRFGARTGPAGELYFDMGTFMVTEKDSKTFYSLPPVTGDT